MEGLLWFDNDPKRPLEQKVLRGAEHYRRKFGRQPTACIVRADEMGDGLQIDGMEVHTTPPVPPYHVLIGETDELGRDNSGGR